MEQAGAINLNMDADGQNKITVNGKPWHRPPTITPNFGKRKKLGPKSNLTQVLLHDNVSQQHLLRAQINNINIEERRSEKLLELHKKSFLVQTAIRQQHLRAIGVTHISFLPDDVAQSNGMLKHAATERPNALKNGQENKTADIVDENNNSSSRKSSRTSSACSLPKIVELADSSPLPVATTNTRSYSAVQISDKPKNFMTHNYHLRREKTVAASSSVRRQTHGKVSVKALKDPRYISLRKTLVPANRPVDGYLQLSPSGQYVLRKYGTPNVDEDTVHRVIRSMTMYGSRLSQEANDRYAGGKTSTPRSTGARGQSDRLVVNHISFAEDKHDSEDSGE